MPAKRTAESLFIVAKLAGHSEGFTMKQLIYILKDEYPGITYTRAAGIVHSNVVCGRINFTKHDGKPGVYLIA